MINKEEKFFELKSVKKKVTNTKLKLQRKLKLQKVYYCLLRKNRLILKILKNRTDKDVWQNIHVKIYNGHK